MTYEEKYKQLVNYIHRELSYSQNKVEDKSTPQEFANFQSGKVLALKGVIDKIKQLEREELK
jgi:hypothetical protein